MRNFTLTILLFIPLFLSSCLKNDNESNHELSAIYHALTDLYATTNSLDTVAYSLESTSSSGVTTTQVAGDVYLSDFRITKTFDTSSGAVESKDSVDLKVEFTSPSTKSTLYIPCKIISISYYKKTYDEYCGLRMQLYDGVNYIYITDYNKKGTFYRSIYGEGSLSISSVVKAYELK